MKITKTGDTARALEAGRKMANAGCDRCPCCGESKEYTPFLHSGIMKVGYGVVWRRGKGFFGFLKEKCCHVDKYHCESCGANWESEPYPVE